jgi:hypothetical protein
MVKQILLNRHYSFQGQVYLARSREPRRGAMIDSFVVIYDIWNKVERSVAAGFFRREASIIVSL